MHESDDERCRREIDVWFIFTTLRQTMYSVNSILRALGRITRVNLMHFLVFVCFG